MDTTDRDSAENIYKSLTDDRKPPNRIEQLDTPTMRILRQFDADDYPAGVEMRRKVARNSLQRALEYYRVENRRIQKVVDELRYKTYSPSWRKKLIYGEAAEFSLFAKNQKVSINESLIRNCRPTYHILYVLYLLYLKCSTYLLLIVSMIYINDSL